MSVPNVSSITSVASNPSPDFSTKSKKNKQETKPPLNPIQEIATKTLATTEKVVPITDLRVEEIENLTKKNTELAARIDELSQIWQAEKEMMVNKLNEANALLTAEREKSDTLGRSLQMFEDKAFNAQVQLDIAKNEIDASKMKTEIEKLKENLIKFKAEINQIKELYYNTLIKNENNETETLAYQELETKKLVTIKDDDNRYFSDYQNNLPEFTKSIKLRNEVADIWNENKVILMENEVTKNWLITLSNLPPKIKKLHKDTQILASELEQLCKEKYNTVNEDLYKQLKSKLETIEKTKESLKLVNNGDPLIKVYFRELNETISKVSNTSMIFDDFEIYRDSVREKLKSEINNIQQESKRLYTDIRNYSAVTWNETLELIKKNDFELQFINDFIQVLRPMKEAFNKINGTKGESISSLGTYGKDKARLKEDLERLSIDFKTQLEHLPKLQTSYLKMDRDYEKLINQANERINALTEYAKDKIKKASLKVELEVMKVDLDIYSINDHTPDNQVIDTILKAEMERRDRLVKERKIAENQWNSTKERFSDTARDLNHMHHEVNWDTITVVEAATYRLGSYSAGPFTTAFDTSLLIETPKATPPKEQNQTPVPKTT